jgi:hypothetical protein
MNYHNTTEYQSFTPMCSVGVVLLFDRQDSAAQRGQLLRVAERLLAHLMLQRATAFYFIRCETFQSSTISTDSTSWLPGSMCSIINVVKVVHSLRLKCRVPSRPVSARHLGRRRSLNETVLKVQADVEVFSLSLCS